MIFKEIELLKNEGAITAKDISYLTQRVMRYESEVLIEIGPKKVNAKSVMGVISLGLKSGTKIVLIAKGSDEEEALRDISNLLTNGNFS